MGTHDTAEAELRPTTRDRVIDAARQAAHVSHEAQLLKSLTADAVEDGVHAVKRVVKSVKRGVEELADLKDEAAHRVKRQPLGAVGLALGVGLMLGMAVGWVGGRVGRRKAACSC